MKRFFTPFFVIAIGAILFCIYLLFMDETGWGTFAAIYIGILAIVVFLIDLFQKKANIGLGKIYSIQLAIISVIVLIYYYGERTQTLEISDDFDLEYVSIVYGVENEKGLSINPFTWTKIVDIPENGIVFTSSDFSANLPETEMRFSSGILLGSEQTDKHLVGIGDYEFEINNKTYKYRSWKIQEGFCCSHSSNEVKERATELMAEISRTKKSADNNASN